MSLRGTLTLECDRPTCHAELVLGDLDVDPGRPRRRGGIDLQLYAPDWRMDRDELICPQCAEGERDERDEAYERAAARARNNDFADTGWKDWT